MALHSRAKTSHARIKKDILDKILNGHWEPGFKLPVETDLAEAYGVSRMTMNKVLTQLSSEGYVMRRKKKGTFVAEKRSQSAVMEITDIEQEVIAQGNDYQWKLLQSSHGDLSSFNTKIFGLEMPARGEALFLEGVHYSQGKPFCLETRYINTVAIPSALEQNFQTHVPGSWMLKAMPWTQVNHRIRAVSVEKPQASLLDLETGSACLEIVRQTEMGADWMTYVQLLYPGEAHQLVAQF